MKIYDLWEEKISSEGAKDFFDEYLEKEMEAYKVILEEGSGQIKGKCSELALRYDMEPAVVAGFLSGMNESIEKPLVLEKLTEDSEIDVQIDFRKLLYNMHKAKANWLYLLKEWDNVLSLEERVEIKKQYNVDNTAVSQKVGRNDPCPCGSGKKYKKCCGQ
ncbi:MAG TPA: SEC-C metal-binding domain-containing protein [Clostridia bacterium]|nr:SEC-C metal-binding domain-containing protein [Clostridia bacterium]